MAVTDRLNSVLAALAIKAPCLAATTANITLSGLQTIDGIVLSADDRVLVKDQTDATENGIYAASTSTWQREPDFDGNLDVVKGTMVRITDGTVNQDAYFAVATSNPIVIGTTSITFTQVNNSLLGVSAFVLTLLDDANAAAFMSTLGITTFMQSVLDDVSEDAALTTLITGSTKTTLHNLILPAAADKANFRSLLEVAIFSTGDSKLTYKTTADTGWVLMDDGSIGSAGSGATNRANADTEDLYTLWWNNISDTYAPVATGRGASAAADFAANKAMTMPLTLSRNLLIAGAGSGLTSRALGETLGREDWELIQHNHADTFTVDSGGAHAHSERGYEGTSGANDNAVNMSDNRDILTSGIPTTVSAGSHGHGLSGGVSNAGTHTGGLTQENMPPVSALNIMVKL